MSLYSEKENIHIEGAIMRISDTTADDITYGPKITTLPTDAFWILKNKIKIYLFLNLFDRWRVLMALSVSLDSLVLT